MAATYSADQIIGKTLVARRNVELKRLPSDTAPVTYTVKPGQTVGVVYSYLLPKAGRSTLYWQFIDANGNYFYAPHKEGIYDIDIIKTQGGKTTEEKRKEEEEKKKLEEMGPFLYYLQKWGGKIAIGAGLLVALNIVLKNNK
jgi:hypothetical protein